MMKIAVIFAAICACAITSLGIAVDTPANDLSRRQVAPSCVDSEVISNPVTFTVNPGVTVVVNSMAGSTNIQQVTVVPGIVGSNTTVFQGSGVNTAMPIVSGGSGTALSLPPKSAAYVLVLVFAFSTDGGDTFSVPTVFCPITVDDGLVTISTISIVDSLKVGNNDILAQITFVS